MQILKGFVESTPIGFIVDLALRVIVDFSGS
jgi:hypothetical protein